MEDTCFETSSNWASSQVESAAFAAVAAVAANAMTQVERIKTRLKELLLIAALSFIRNYPPRSHDERCFRKCDDRLYRIPRPGRRRRWTPTSAGDFGASRRSRMRRRPFWRHVRDALAERYPAAGGDDKSSDAAPADLCV